MEGQETTAQDIKKVHGIFGLTLLPKDSLVEGSVLRVEINGMVLVFDSTAMRTDTLWKTTDGRLQSAPIIILQAETMDELKETIHNHVEKMFHHWHLINKQREEQKMKESNERMILEQQPTGDALEQLAKEGNPELPSVSLESIKVVDLNIESKLSPSIAELQSNGGNK